MTETLTAFLLARFAEDEAVAESLRRNSAGDPWGWQPNPHPMQTASGSRVAVTPARVLADVEAKRRIVARVAEIDAEYDRAEKGDGMVGAWAVEESVGLDIAVRALALPYADHPDYREEWRP